MKDIKEAIKSYMEDTTYQSSSDFDFEYRVEQTRNNDYEVYIESSFATIIYTFIDVQDVKDQYEDIGDEPVYSAIIDFVSCNIEPFHADSNTNYYLDELNHYIRKCELVASMMDCVDTYFDDRRTVFSW